MKSRRCRIAAIALLTIACSTLPARTQRRHIGPHEATLEREQQRQLDELLPPDSWSRPPSGIDPEIWRNSLPHDNLPNATRIALGRRLYFDPLLSADGTVSCATCHDVTRGFSDQRPVSEGIFGQLGRRNAPTTLNVALMTTQFLDGRAATLEEQALLPIQNPIEMGTQTKASVLRRLERDGSYPEQFKAAYGRAPNWDDLGRAIAAFERTLVFLDSPFDAWRRGDAGALSDVAKRGFDLYHGRARCATCHPLTASNPLGSNFRFHNIGVAARTQDFEVLAKKGLAALEQDDSEAAIDQLALGTDLSELGRFLITKNYADIGSFKTSSVRNVGITGPYMHDGSMTTLWDVMDHYNKGGEANAYLDGGIEPLALTEAEIDAVVAFLFALTDRRFAAQNRKLMAAQSNHSAKNRPFRNTDLAMREKDVFADRIGVRLR